MENKYYIPTIQDIRIGYEFECQDPENLDDWKLDEIDKNNISNVIKELIRTPSQIRVSFLTIQQIIEEGWKQDIKKSDEKFGSWFSKDSYYFRYKFIKIPASSIYLDTSSPYLLITHDPTQTFVFNGMCKSVNEFRIIMRLLNIK